MKKLIKFISQSKVLSILSLLLVLFVVIPECIFGVLYAIAYFGHRAYYKKTLEKYSVIAEDYITEKYGDRYEMIASKEATGGWGVFGDAFQGINFVFTDKQKQENDFVVYVRADEVVSDNHDIRNPPEESRASIESVYFDNIRVFET